MLKEQYLLKAITEGDVSAFSQLFYAHHQQLGLYAFTVIRCQETAEEIVQDVFLKVWQHREKLAAVANIKAYLFTITKNETLNAIRKVANERKRRQAFENDLLDADSNLTVDLAEEENEVHQVFEHAVSSLPPQQQKVFLLRQQGLKHAQISVEMSISLHSAKKYQQLAMQSIERFLRAKAGIIILFFIFFLKK